MIAFYLLYFFALLGFIAHFFYLSHWSLMAMSILIVFNTGLSFKWIWREQGKIVRVFIINILQLVIFTCVFRLIYLLEGARHYIFANPPQLWDWCQLTLVHVLRAADFMDAIEGYGWQLQNIKSKGYISGTPLVLLHLLVDFFLFTAIYKLFSGTFIKKFIPALKKLGKLFFILGSIGLISVLLNKYQTHYQFLFWTLISFIMLFAINHWSFDISKKLKGGYIGESVVDAIREDAQILSGCFFYAIITIFIFFYWRGGENLLWQSMIWFCYLFAGLFAFGILANIFYYLFVFISKIKILFAFVPLILFTAFLGAFSYWLYPQWLMGDVSFYMFALENLFRAIDLLDTSQIYGWNWSGGQYESWVFASLVVSYRFLASAFFYQTVYRLIVLWGASKVLPIEKTIEMLKDADYATRTSAREELLRSDDPRIVPYIFPLLSKDEPERLRLLALKICHKLADSKAVVFLAPLILEKPKICEAALETLEKFPSKEVSPHMLKYLESDDSQVRQTAINVLEKFNAQEAIEHVTSLIFHKKGTIRAAAVETLLCLKANKEIVKLIPLLADVEAKVREKALRAVEYWGNKDYIDKVIPLLEDSHREVRSAAISALGGLKAKRAANKIVLMLKDEDEFVRIEALRVLGDLQIKSKIDNIIPLLKDKEFYVQEEAINSLGKLEAKKAIPDLISLLEPLYLKRTVRGRFGDLEDWDWEISEKRHVAFKALETLVELKSSKAMEHINRLMQVEEEDVQEAAQKAMSKMKNENGV